MEAAKRRQGALRRHLTGKTEEDVVVVCALRTPITKARKGGLKDTPADDLVAAVLKGVLDKTGKTSLIEKKTYEEKKPMKKKNLNHPSIIAWMPPQTHARHNARHLRKVIFPGDRCPVSFRG